MTPDAQAIPALALLAMITGGWDTALRGLVVIAVLVIIGILNRADGTTCGTTIV